MRVEDMPGGRKPDPERGGHMDTGTLCRANSPKPGFVCGSKNPVIIRDEGRQQTRKIFKDSIEFKANYIDYNIKDADYWSTAYAKKQKGYRDFWVNYRDGRRLKFNLDDIPVRYRVTKTNAGKWVVYEGVGFSFEPRIYYKREGFIYPDHFGEGSTPRLIDIATTIEINHRQKEKFLEIATFTFKFAVILASYAGAFSSGGIPKAPRSRVRIGGAPTQSPSFSLASNKVWHYAGAISWFCAHLEVFRPFTDGQGSVHLAPGLQPRWCTGRGLGALRWIYGRTFLESTLHDEHSRPKPLPIRYEGV